MDQRDIEDLIRPFGRVDVKRMFGGHGVYADGAMFALQAYGEIYLRVDGETLPLFEARGLAPFIYENARGATTLPYRKLPEEAHEDADELVRWSRLGLEAARRTKKVKAKQAVIGLGKTKTPRKASVRRPAKPAI